MANTAHDELYRADLIRILFHYQRSNALMTKDVAEASGLAASRLSKLYNGDVHAVSVERLLKAFSRLGLSIDIRVYLVPGGQPARIEVSGPSRQSHQGMHD